MLGPTYNDERPSTVIDCNLGIATVNAIGKNSKNPERAMMLLNLVTTDKGLYYKKIPFGLSLNRKKRNVDYQMPALKMMTNRTKSTIAKAAPLP